MRNDQQSELEAAFKVALDDHADRLDQQARDQLALARQSVLHSHATLYAQPTEQALAFKSALDDYADQVDRKTRDQLALARQSALEGALSEQQNRVPKKGLIDRFNRLNKMMTWQTAMPFAGVAASALVVVMWLNDPLQPGGVSSSNSTPSVELVSEAPFIEAPLSSEQDEAYWDVEPELLEEFEFVAWLLDEELISDEGMMDHLLDEEIGLEMILNDQIKEGTASEPIVVIEQHAG